MSTAKQILATAARQLAHNTQARRMYPACEDYFRGQAHMAGMILRVHLAFSPRKLRREIGAVMRAELNLVRRITNSRAQALPTGFRVGSADGLGLLVPVGATVASNPLLTVREPSAATSPSVTPSPAPSGDGVNFERANIAAVDSDLTTAENEVGTHVLPPATAGGVNFQIALGGCRL